MSDDNIFWMSDASDPTSLTSSFSPFARSGAKLIYTLEPGDKWAWFGDHILVCNGDKIPFTIDLATGERKNIEITVGDIVYVDGATPREAIHELPPDGVMEVGKTYRGGEVRIKGA